MAKKLTNKTPTKKPKEKSIIEEPKPKKSKAGKSKIDKPIRNIIINYNKIDNDIKLELQKKYPEGYANFVHRYPKPNGEFFFAVPLEVKDMNYLIKVEVKIDNIISEEDFDKHFGEISEVDSKAVIDEVEVDTEEDDANGDQSDIDELDEEDESDE